MLKKRILASTMASVMALSAVPFVAFADEAKNPTYATRDELRSYVKDMRKFEEDELETYGERSQLKFSTILEYADKIAESSRSTPDQVAAAYAMLYEAKQQLKYHDYADLRALINDCKDDAETENNRNLGTNKIEDLIWTEGTWSDFEGAYYDADDLKDSASLKETTDAYELLEDYHKALEKLNTVTRTEFSKAMSELTAALRKEFDHNAWERGTVSGVQSDYNKTYAWGTLFYYVAQAFDADGEIMTTYEDFIKDNLRETSQTAVVDACKATQQAADLINGWKADSLSSYTSASSIFNLVDNANTGYKTKIYEKWAPMYWLLQNDENLTLADVTAAGAITDVKYTNSRGRLEFYFNKTGWEPVNDNPGVEIDGFSKVDWEELKEELDDIFTKYSIDEDDPQDLVTKFSTMSVDDMITVLEALGAEDVAEEIEEALSDLAFTGATVDGADYPVDDLKAAFGNALYEKLLAGQLGATAYSDIDTFAEGLYKLQNPVTETAGETATDYGVIVNETVGDITPVENTPAWNSAANFNTPMTDIDEVKTLVKAVWDKLKADPSYDPDSDSNITTTFSGDFKTGGDEGVAAAKAAVGAIVIALKAKSDTYQAKATKLTVEAKWADSIKVAATGASLDADDFEDILAAAIAGETEFETNSIAVIIGKIKDYIGETYSLTATVAPDEGEDDEDVVTVSQNAARGYKIVLQGTTEVAEGAIDVLPNVWTLLFALVDYDGSGNAITPANLGNTADDLLVYDGELMGIKNKPIGKEANKDRKLFNFVYDESAANKASVNNPRTGTGAFQYSLEDKDGNKYERVDSHVTLKVVLEDLGVFNANFQELLDADTKLTATNMVTWNSEISQSDREDKLGSKIYDASSGVTVTADGKTPGNSEYKIIGNYLKLALSDLFDKAEAKTYKRSEFERLLDDSKQLIADSGNSELFAVTHDLLVGAVENGNTVLAQAAKEGRDITKDEYELVSKKYAQLEKEMAAFKYSFEDVTAAIAKYGYAVVDASNKEYYGDKKLEALVLDVAYKLGTVQDLKESGNEDSLYLENEGATASIYDGVFNTYGRVYTEEGEFEMWKDTKYRPNGAGSDVTFKLAKAKDGTNYTHYELTKAYEALISYTGDTGSTGGLLGDVNGDGKVNSADALYILEAAAKGTVSEINIAVGDYDKNGTVGSADALAILAALAAGTV